MTCVHRLNKIKSLFSLVLNEHLSGQLVSFQVNRESAQENAKTMPIVELFGSDLESMFQNVVSSIGNYGEIYTRNLEQILPRSGPNRLNRNPQSLLSTYVPPGLF